MSKLFNEYAGCLPSRMYANTPKAVFAALAVSFALRFNEDAVDAVPETLRTEWDVLHLNGIVPQAAPMSLNAARVRKFKGRRKRGAVKTGGPW